jgi:diguanylate cyclase (GGDEF)-like protein
MIPPEVPTDDASRVATLRGLGLLDTASEERFDRITRLAQRILGVPIALVSLVDADRQWFKSSQGLGVPETSREVSFCGHAINDNKVLLVPDATADARFHDNPLVTGDPHIRFYAGCPIAAPSGDLVGTLCVIDREPRNLSPEDVTALTDLAAMVEHEISSAQLSVVDELTGITNRRGFYLVANQALALCRRLHEPALVLYADLNGLKVTNDVHGHKAGDELITRAADVLASTFRVSDVVARVGGDEFAAFLSSYYADPSMVAGHLAERVEAANAELAPAPFRLSFSTGYAFSEAWGTETLEELVRHADLAMYEAKRANRASSTT